MVQVQRSLQLPNKWLQRGWSELLSTEHHERTRSSGHKLQSVRNENFFFFYHKGQKTLEESLSLETFKTQPDSLEQAEAATSLVPPGEGLPLPTQTDPVVLASGSH